jgi:perosamine synthetase
VKGGATATGVGVVERISELERRYVADVLDHGFRTSAGDRYTRRLEAAFAAVVGVKYAIALANGTMTLHAALAAAGVGPGDEVIVPPLTMSSTAFSVLHAGATPIFADVDPGTWALDPASVEERITERTRAVMPVALFGLAPDLDELMAVAGRHGLFLLEDDAQCFLGKIGSRAVGSIGHAASFSLQSSKHLSAGEGGLIVTDDRELADRIRRFSGLGYATLGATHGRISRDVIQDPDYARHVEMGFNYRISELCAAVSLAQVERIEELVDVRLRAGRAFEAAVQGHEWLVPQVTPSGFTHTYWTYGVRLARGDVTWHEFRDAFREHGGDGIYAAWRLSYLEPWFEALAGDVSCPVAEALQPRLLLFKTNYWDPNELAGQVEALEKTIRRFD